uniref:Uncharacterized protein n=1 Tax=Oryza barthii TaxID=65489 RepID=A0A0D3ERM8_9ORYZ
MSKLMLRMLQGQRLKLNCQVCLQEFSNMNLIIYRGFFSLTGCLLMFLRACVRD